MDHEKKITYNVINVDQTPPPKPTRPGSLEGRHQILCELIQHQNETSQAQYMELTNLRSEIERREHSHLNQKKHAVLQELLFVHERKALQAKIEKQQKAMEELRQTNTLANLTIYEQNITILQLSTSSNQKRKPSFSTFVCKLFCRNKSSTKQQVNQTKQYHDNDGFVKRSFARLFKRHI